MSSDRHSTAALAPFEPSVASSTRIVPFFFLVRRENRGDGTDLAITPAG
jgi:hypothetical protein